MTGRSLPRLVLVLSLLGTLLYAAADEQWAAFVVTAPLLILGAALTRGGGAAAMPKWLVRILVLCVLAWAARTMLLGRVDVTAVCRLMLVVLVLKMFDRRRTRDYGLMILLLGLLAVATTLLSPRLFVAVLLVLFGPLFLWTVLQFQFFSLAETIERQREALGAVGPPGNESLVRAENAAGRGVRRRSTVLFQLQAVIVVMLLGGSVICAAVFVTIPRGLGRDFFMRSGRYQGATTGFSDRVRLGESGLISQSSAIALDIDIRDENGQSVGSPNEFYYLRGAVLDTYENGEWRPSQNARIAKQRQTAGEEMRFAGPTEEGRRLVQTITLRAVPSERAYLFSLWRPFSITVSEDAPIHVESNTFTLESDLPPGRFRYRIVSESNTRTARGEGERPIASFPSRVIRELAEQVLAADGLDPDPDVRPREQDGRAARAIENWLRTNFNYSLEMRRSPANQDPIEWFLDESNRTGHCEYFASAMTAMCRSVGIPARVVTGYLAAEWNDQTRTYVVRQSHAHAWVEAEVLSNVWRTYDPTPPSDLRQIHQRQPSFMARIGRFFDSLEYLWISSVVSFDESTRERLIGGQATELTAPTNEQVRARMASLRRIGIALVNGVIVFAVVYIAFRSRLLMGRFTFRRGSRADRAADWAAGDPRLEALAAQCGFYEELLRRQAALGHAKPDWNPPERHAASLVPIDPRLASISSRLSRLFYVLRFGQRELTGDESRELDTCLADLRGLAEAR